MYIGIRGRLKVQPKHSGITPVKFGRRQHKKIPQEGKNSHNDKYKGTSESRSEGEKNVVFKGWGYDLSDSPLFGWAFRIRLGIGTGGFAWFKEGDIVQTIELDHCSSFPSRVLITWSVVTRHCSLHHPDFTCSYGMALNLSGWSKPPFASYTLLNSSASCRVELGHRFST